MGLSEQQLESVKAGAKALKETGLAFTQGYAGVGKTYLMRNIVSGDLPPEVDLPAFTEVVGVAPTWAAAKQATMSTGLQFVSDHSVLYGKPKEDEKGRLSFGKANAGKIPYGALVLADERGMTGNKVGTDLHAMCEAKGALLWGFGDLFQLGPVNESRYFTEDKVTYTLTQVVRQNPGPGLRMLTAMRSGECKNYGDMQRFADRNELIDCGMLKTNYTRRFIEKFVKEGTGQIICYYNATRNAINSQAREYLGFSGKTLNVGERIVFLSNVEPVVNSDVAMVADIGPAPPGVHDQIQRISYLDLRFRRVTLADGRRVVVSLTLLENGRELFKELSKQVKRFKGNWREKKKLEKALLSFPLCDYAYAITGHKSQGSQYEQVYAVLESRQINWLYTVASRFQSQLMFSWK